MKAEKTAMVDSVECDAFESRIFMAGDIEVAKQVCREFCMTEGFCVTVTPTNYIYTGGEEAGFVVGAINYARFPGSRYALEEKTQRLAELLMVRCCQHSYTVFGPQMSRWFSRRPT
jgi:hypothetical protein